MPRGRPRKNPITETPSTDTATLEPSPVAVEFKEETPPETVVKAPLGSIRAKISTVKISQKYDVWMGVQDDCPFWTVHAGGRDFSKENEVVSYDEDSRETRREKVQGKVVSLTKEEIDFIAIAVGKKVVRKFGSRASIRNTDDPRYSFSGTDTPLGQYLFMQVLEPNLPHDWRNRSPEAMA